MTQSIGWPRGGMVTQRIANPFIPVRFWAWPPKYKLFYLIKKTFSVVIPPPNVTGRLHMGHALNNSLQDVLIRFNRMKGFERLWQPGTDHAGIATQAVVEKNLENEDIKKNDLGREKFIEKVG